VGDRVLITKPLDVNEVPVWNRKMDWLDGKVGVVTSVDQGDRIAGRFHMKDCSWVLGARWATVVKKPITITPEMDASPKGSVIDALKPLRNFTKPYDCKNCDVKSCKTRKEPFSKSKGILATADEEAKAFLRDFLTQPITMPIDNDKVPLLFTYTIGHSTMKSRREFEEALQEALDRFPHLAY